MTRTPTFENAGDAEFVGLQNRSVPWSGDETLMISNVRPWGAGTLPMKVMKAASPTRAPPNVDRQRQAAVRGNRAGSPTDCPGDVGPGEIGRRDRTVGDLDTRDLAVADVCGLDRAVGDLAGAAPQRSPGPRWSHWRRRSSSTSRCCRPAPALRPSAPSLPSCSRPWPAGAPSSRWRSGSPPPRRTRAGRPPRARPWQGARPWRLRRPS